MIQVKDILDKLENPVELIKNNDALKEASPKSGSWEWFFKDNKIYFSPELKSLLGHDPQEPLPAKGFWRGLIHPDDRSKIVNHFIDYLNGFVSFYEQVFKLRHTCGKYLWVNSRIELYRDENGDIDRITGVYTDITEQKEQVSQIKISEDKYKNLFQNSMIAMVRSNINTGNILEANEKFWHLFNVPNEERHVTTCESIIGRKNTKTIYKLLDANGSIDDLELKVETSEGTLWISLGAVLYPAEEVVDCIIKDITETKSSLIELQKVNFELDSFIYHASHDLRSPLRSILGLIDLFRIETDVRVRQECIEKIEGSVKRLDSLVVELLSISRNDRVNDPHTFINLMVEINNSISSYYNASNTEGLEILTNIKQPVDFYSDLTRVRIILNNLISNAIKYRSFHKERSFIKIEATVDADKATIEVTDNGEGIEESKLPHIFDMFYRATEKSEGSGLGLYIVKRVADKLKAQIHVTSEELEGTTFKFVIPNTK
ncbi:ATP-binding protein [Fulvivirga ligni]|uniref:ATP-binding protein n=1 Tax=Fulvivirga ligni TaxID=2904246 RepID=UPI001F2935D0|nr:ATP-binding protein [Fulvivirga ligni]UII21815.1 PAS domain-containing sensor histidine kinase [Fulvivirga ligni]